MVEPPTDFNASDIVSGVAKVNDKLIVLLDTKKLISVDDMSIFEEEGFEVKEAGDKVEVMRKIEGMGGEMVVKEVMDAKDFFEKKGINANDPRYALFDEMVSFMNAIATQDYEKTDSAIQNIMGKGQSDLFQRGRKGHKKASRLHKEL